MPRISIGGNWFGWRRITALSVLLLVALAGSMAAQLKKKKLPPPPLDLPGHVNYLAQQLYGVPLDESEPLTSQIEKLVLDHTGQWLMSHPASSGSAARPGDIPYEVRVRHELESVFGSLQYPFTAVAATFDKPFGKGQLIGVGYSLGWTDFNRASVVALFQVEDRNAQQVAVNHFAPYVDIHFRFFTPPPAAADQVWFLAYGTRLGKSHPRLSAMLYAFDGKTLQSLWQTTDVYDGRITFPGDRTVISYLNENEFTQAVAAHSPAVRHEAAYRVGPKGFEVEYDH